MFDKQKILNIINVYTAHAFQSQGRWFVGAGSETEPVVQLYDLARRSSETLPDCPGGMMSFLPVPGGPDRFVSIMGLFPPFIGKEAGLYMHERDKDRWNTRKALDLPFAHRCEFYRSKEETFLLAATVSRFKADPSDWSQPGEVYVIPVHAGPDLPWKADAVPVRIFRNHGMARAMINGEEHICVSGKEGIFSVGLSRENGWTVRPLFSGEVSEMAFLDMDGDGTDELATIEPFHGDTLNLYKMEDGQWQKVFSEPLSFGHGLSAGLMNGSPVVVAGNRSGSLALEVFMVDDLNRGAISRSVIEENAGPTQTQVFSVNGKDILLSANQKKNEVALYSVRTD